MPEFPRQFPHLYISGGGRSERYTTRASLRTPPPPERDPAQHGRKLEGEIARAIALGRQQIAERNPDIARGAPGFYLQFDLSAQEAVALEKLENKRQEIELLAVQEPETPEEPLRATVYVPQKSANYFLKKVRSYEAEKTKTGKPKNEPLVSRLDEVRLGTVEALYTDEKARLPARNQSIWWELWLRAEMAQDFEFVARSFEIVIKPNELHFPERRVILVKATLPQLENLIRNSAVVAEIRTAKDTPAIFMAMGPAEQEARVADAAGRLQGPGGDAVAVSVLDSGVVRAHALIAPVLNPEDEHSYEPGWGLGDSNFWRGHGTRMCRLAIYGDLVPVLNSQGAVVLTHRLESVRILPPTGDDNDPLLYGAITTESVSRPETVAPNRKRVFCMAVTSPVTSKGRPSSWSSAIDQLAVGDQGLRRLLVLSAGNVRGDIYAGNYPHENDIQQVENPAQAWNALTVGAHTEKTAITDPDYTDWEPIAPAGNLSPTSRTSVLFERQWPIKPDIVLEGGNMATDGGPGAWLDDLVLLTTDHRIVTRQFTTFSETSAATALAARMATQVLAYRPEHWPETIRALLVHSAEWTPSMLEYLNADNRREHKIAFLRRYGYGVPTLERCLFSARNDLTLVVEDQLRPFTKENYRIKTRDMKLHRLPWPTEQLLALGESPVQLCVTLSYFVEPNPGERGWTRRHSYASHGLRFEVKRAEESVDAFRRRINKMVELEELGARVAARGGADNWLLGNIRNRGSIHSDVWNGTAADLATRDAIGIFPVGGWWKDTPGSDHWNKEVRYSLIVSIRAPESEIDIYTPVMNAVRMQTQVEI